MAERTAALTSLLLLLSPGRAAHDLFVAVRKRLLAHQTARHRLAALAKASVGTAVLSAAMFQTTALAGLVEVPLVEPVIYRSISLVWRRSESLAPAAEALYEIVKAQLSRGSAAR